MSSTRIYSVVEDHEDKKAEEVEEEAPVEEEVQEEEAQEEEEEAGERTLGSILKPGVTTVEQFLQFLHPHTPAYNPHFPNTNQTKHCWSSYINYTQCTKLKGEGDAECRRFYVSARSLCPDEWLDSWAEAKEEDKFASPYDVTSEKPAH